MTNDAPRTEVCLCDSCNEEKSCSLTTDPYLLATEGDESDYWLCAECLADLTEQARDAEGE